MKRVILKVELVLFGRAYCASPYEGNLDDPDDLAELSMPVPIKRWAERASVRRGQKAGATWYVTKWRRT